MMCKKNILLLLNVLLLCACVSNQSSPTSPPTTTGPVASPIIPTDIPADAPMPAVVTQVFPKGTISLSSYNATLGGYGDHNGVSVIVIAERERIGSGSFKLGLDGSTLLYADSLGDGLMNKGPFYVHWELKLEPGYHEANFELTYSDGETLNYTWHFVITDD